MGKRRNMIRSSRIHFNKHTNKQKLNELKDFIEEYKRISKIIIDHLWTNGINDDKYQFNIKENKLNFPKMLSKQHLPNIETTLTARSIKCITTQICGIINAVINKRKKDLNKQKYLLSKGLNISKQLKERIKKPLAKPEITSLNPELNSILCDLKEVNGKFNAFFNLKSFTNTKRAFTIKIPVKYHKQFNKWKSKGKLLSSISLDNTSITFRFEIENKIKNNGNTIGADQGMKTVLTFSDGQTTPNKDKHNHTLESIIDKLSRKIKGSKAFGKAQEHRKNFINWSINQLSLTNIKTINLEKIVNINFGKRTSRKMSSWTNTIIRDKIIRLAEEHEVHVSLQSSSYRSQRCCKCGIVRKANRKSKIYSCNNCGNILDSDLNAAKNHECSLPDIPFGLRCKGYNLGKGFFWKESGLYTFTGEELTVPLHNNQ